MNTKSQIERYKIPKVTISELADCQPGDISRYLKNPRLVTSVKIDRIERAVADIVGVLDAYSAAQAECHGPSLGLDLRDATALKRLIEFARTNQAERQTEIETESALSDAFRSALPSSV
jgi:hypothetical protein